MGRNHLRHRRMPCVEKYKSALFLAQFSKISEEFCELGAENANLANKIKKGERITRQDVEKAYLEAFDVSQAAQQYMYIIHKKFGKHYCFTVDEMFDKGINKNKVRGYYDSEGDIE